MVFYAHLFHGLKLGFEYIPELGEKGTLVIEVAFLRAVFIFGVIHGPSDVQDSD